MYFVAIKMGRRENASIPILLWKEAPVFFCYFRGSEAGAERPGKEKPEKIENTQNIGYSSVRTPNKLGLFLACKSLFPTLLLPSN
jgi:hypothetical protein